MGLAFLVRFLATQKMNVRIEVKIKLSFFTYSIILSKSSLPTVINMPANSQITLPKASIIWPFGLLALSNELHSAKTTAPCGVIETLRKDFPSNDDYTLPDKQF